MRRVIANIQRVAVLFTTPLGMRIDEGLGGTVAQVSVRVFGPDLEVLETKAQEIASIARSVDGLTDLRVESASGVPQLQLSIDRDAASRQGVTAGELAEAIRSLAVSEVLRRQMGSAGRNRVRRLFTWDRAAAQVVTTQHDVEGLGVKPGHSILAIDAPENYATLLGD